MKDDFEYQVRHRAYELWVSSGRPDGMHGEFWDRAEKELLAKLKDQNPADPALRVDPPDDT